MEDKIEKLKRLFTGLPEPIESYTYNSLGTTCLNIIKLSNDFTGELNKEGMDFLNKSFNVNPGSIVYQFRLDTNLINQILEARLNIENPMLPDIDGISIYQPLEINTIIKYTLDNDILDPKLILEYQYALWNQENLINELKKKVKYCSNQYMKNNIFLNKYNKDYDCWIKTMGMIIGRGKVLEIPVLPSFNYLRLNDKRVSDIVEVFINLNDPVILNYKTSNYHIIRQYKLGESIWKITN